MRSPPPCLGCGGDAVDADLAAGTLGDSTETEASRSTSLVIPEEIEGRQIDGRLLRQMEIDFLRGQGVPAKTILKDGWGRWSMIRTAAVVDIGRGRFDFAEDVADQAERGFRAYTVVACDRSGSPSDIVAWTPKLPSALSWLGRAAILGEEELSAPRLEGGLVVHRDALAWLQAGRTGIAPVLWDRLPPVLRDEGELLVEDADTERRLQSILRTFPRIVRRDRVAA